MGMKTFYSLLTAIILILLFSIYWFVPLNTTNFNLSSNYNFSLNSSENNTLQFYSNMRFPETTISYKIEECSLQRTDDMQWAFNIIHEETPLDFYPVEYGQEITITCNDTVISEGGLFTAGEGGPTNITAAGDFNIIESGKILLLKNSDCEKPNIALHELLHVLGFTHSKNPKNIMYKISECDQTIGEDITNLISYIYSIPAEPDLLFESASATMHGRYLNLNFSIRNNGMKFSGGSIVNILADGKQIKQINISPIEIGYGRQVYIENILINQVNVHNIEFIIENNFEELSKINNKIIFEIKK